MQLYFNPAAPYVRKVSVTAHELGFSGRIEPISIVLSPVPRAGRRCAARRSRMASWMPPC
jgi:glutathione S-transferase